MLRLISVICAAGAFVVPAATANAATVAPTNSVSCSFFRGSSTGPATTSCIAFTYTFREWVVFCRPNANSNTGYESFNVPSYDVLETDSVYSGNSQAHLIYSDSTPGHLDDWPNAVDLGPCTEP